MPSPFPGMDPFVESWDNFPCVHLGMLVRMMESLQGQLPDAYFAALDERVIVVWPHDEHNEPFLEIYKKGRNGKRLVCTVEILSPSNKAPGERGRTLYLRQQRTVLKRKIHLVEIDLLRAGKHTTAVALDWAKEKTGEFDYHVCVRRFNRFEQFDVYPI